MPGMEGNCSSPYALYEAWEIDMRWYKKFCRNNCPACEYFPKGREHGDIDKLND